MQPPASLDAWMFDRLLALVHGPQRDTTFGGMHERLGEDLKPRPMGFKRLVVQCRQMYVASHAYLLRRDPRDLELATHLFDWVLAHYRDPVHGGWWFSVTPDGSAPVDRSKDFYGHAFTLFALGWYLRASGDARVHAVAAHTADMIEGPLAHPNGLGHWVACGEDWTPKPGIRQQNPHMHLLEGYLSLLEATGPLGEGGARWVQGAERVMELVTQRFIGADGVLGEYYTDDWAPHPEEGHRAEPGHHYEWAWLLAWAADRLGRPEALAAAKGLHRFAEGCLLPEDRVLDEVDRQGRPVKTTRRIWPGGERIKALGLFGTREQLDRAIAALFRDYLRPDGTWVEHLNADGSPMTDYLPGTTPYHIFLALAEARRALSAPAPAAPVTA
ncbi:MAG TPA: AGE family epimerase/isomerase [Azospirillaceae bacterium]|nr:AGE family epimerase/isomerase [Azospirillaceae bacterium]